jgi:hypothetical protein
MLTIIVLGAVTTALGVGFGWTVLELTMRALEHSLDEPRVKPVAVHRGMFHNGRTA